MPCRSTENSHRLTTLAHAILIALILPFAGAIPSMLQAQEIRVTGGTASAPDSELIGGRGWGVGVRYFHWEGLGFGVESDRYSNDAALVMACPPDPSGCLTEAVDFTTDLNTTSFIALIAFGAGDDLRFRFGGGRVAGTVITSRGIGRQTGEEVEVPAADRGAGMLSWSRGADGNVIVFEALYRLPVPLPISAFGSFRRHDLRMEGCGAEFSFLCGALNHREFQLGLVAHLFSRRGSP